MSTPSNPHQNHRSRLRARFLRAGLTDFDAHNVLELLLFYAVPRRDTNPIAHALLSRFKTVDATLTAEHAALCEVTGVGDGIARFLRGFHRFSAFALTRREPRVTYTGADALGRHYCSILQGKEEAVAVTLFDNDHGMIREYYPAVRDIHSPHFSITDILADALLSSAPLCALAHVHADGLALPVGEDLDITRLLRSTLEAGGVHLLEHFIVSGDRYTTLLYRYSGQGPIHEDAVQATVDPDERRALTEFLALAGLSADADALLAAYGSLYRLVTAPIGRHRREGLDDRLTALLALVAEADTYRAAERPVPPSADISALGRYLTDYFRALSAERVLLLLFDRSGRHIATEAVGNGSVSEAGVSARLLTENALFSGAAQAVLAHNHPCGACDPSDEDTDITAHISRALSSIGVELLRHYIVAGEHFFAMQ